MSHFGQLTWPELCAAARVELTPTPDETTLIPHPPTISFVSNNRGKLINKNPALRSAAAMTISIDTLSSLHPLSAHMGRIRSFPPDRVDAFIAHHQFGMQTPPTHMCVHIQTKPTSLSLPTRTPCTWHTNGTPPHSERLDMVRWQISQNRRLQSMDLWKVYVEFARANRDKDNAARVAREPQFANLLNYFLQFGRGGDSDLSTHALVSVCVSSGMWATISVAHGDHELLINRPSSVRE